MIDFCLRDIVAALGNIEGLRMRASGRDPGAFPDAVEAETIRALLQGLATVAQTIQMRRTSERLEWMFQFLTPMTSCNFGALNSEAFELSQAVFKDSSEQFFCHYDATRLGFLQRMPKEWGAVFDAFPSAKPEIEEGIDCYALGHNSACVFHMARVGEIGLRAIGRERSVETVRGHVPIEWGTWGQVFQAIEPEIEKIQKKTNGPEKDAALAFYKTVLSDLRAIQSYRDQTMHFRDSYDDGEAQSAIFRVRQLMTMLATKLNENSIGEIPWNAWGARRSS